MRIGNKDVPIGMLDFQGNPIKSGRPVKAKLFSGWEEKRKDKKEGPVHPKTLARRKRKRKSYE